MPDIDFHNLDISSTDYKKHIKEEAYIWSDAAKKEAKQYPPDYQYYKSTLAYHIYRNHYLQLALSYIQPKQRILELGCYNGWFSLELARKGAIIDAHDIAAGAIDIAKQYYSKQKKKENFTGSITFHVSDLNNVRLPRNTYDVIVIRGLLHHVARLDDLIPKLYEASRNNGLLIVDDGLPMRKKEALLLGMLLMLLPTDIPYTQKLQRVFKKKNVLQRTQDMANAKGASPFEGVSGSESVDYIKKYFNIVYFTTFASFVGAVAPRLQVPNIIKIPLLHILNLLDNALVASRITTGSVYFLIGKAEKKKRIG